MNLDFNAIRPEIEKVFDIYRTHKYYTLFKDEVNTPITSHIDKIGGGRSNKISDQTASVAVETIYLKAEAKKIVELVEKAVSQLPDVEQTLIKHRYMSRNHIYINDYMVYQDKMYISPKTYRKVREMAFEKLYIMLVSNNSPFNP